MVTIPSITATKVQTSMARQTSYMWNSITDPKNKGAKKHYWAYLQNARRNAVCVC